MKEFNIKKIVKCKLTPKGMNILNERISQSGYIPMDQNGYFSFKLWEFMNIFGNSVYEGNDVIVDDTILILNKDLHKHKN